MQIDSYGFTLDEVIYNGRQFLLYRGKLKDTDQSVIIKTTISKNPSPEEVYKIKNEFEIARKIQKDFIICALDFISLDKPFLILEDFGGISLKAYLRNHSLQIEESLDIMIQIVNALAAIHSEGIIHKDLKPSNIIIHPDTKKIKITDFGISVLQNKEYVQLTNPNLLEGTLEYLSPEQTGRMNRQLDYQTDYYSLGITFYEMLTGKLPFRSTDPLELIHMHLAQEPKSVNEIDRQIPITLSRIISKLLSKSPEDRYFSEAGLVSDLKYSKSEFEKVEFLDNYTLGVKDKSTKFNIPEKLYGREEEVKLLLSTYEKIRHGESHFF